MKNKIRKNKQKDTQALKSQYAQIMTIKSKEIAIRHTEIKNQMDHLYYELLESGAMSRKFHR